MSQKTVFGEKLEKALMEKVNDKGSFVWKMAKKADGSQEEVRLVDATDGQLRSFYAHCQSMLHNEDKLNPGRYPLLGLIDEQRRKCNVELFLRKLEQGAICADGKPYPRHLYFQDIRAYMNAHKPDFPVSELGNISVATVTGGLPREFERVSIADVIDGCLERLGFLTTKHITFSFILGIGVYLTPGEMKDFDVKDKDGKTRKKPDVIKERLGIDPNVRLRITPGGLSFSELRAMLNLRPRKYSEFTTEQLMILRDKVLFLLEDEVRKHIEQWEERIRQLELVAHERGLELEDDKGREAGSRQEKMDTE